MSGLGPNVSNRHSSPLCGSPGASPSASHAAKPFLPGALGCVKVLGTVTTMSAIRRSRRRRGCGGFLVCNGQVHLLPDALVEPAQHVEVAHLPRIAIHPSPTAVAP